MRPQFLPTLLLVVLSTSTLWADASPKVAPVVPVPIQPFSHDELKLLAGPFLHAQEMGHKYLLDLDVDRLLAPCYEAMGKQPKKPRYGGWEEKGVSGHMLGHWLSGTSRMVAQTGDPELKKRLDYAISELAALQAPNGYVSGFPEKPFLTVWTGKFDVQGFSLAGHWVPWYTMHKLFAGLIDTYEITGNKQALDVVTKLADWAKAGTDHLDETQFQRMLRCEHGGMNESLAELYAITGKKDYLDLSQRFIDKQVLNPLAAQRDQLTNLHANTQIPKIVGAARLYELTGNDYYKNIASYFWTEVTTKRSYVFGGNSISEHFRKLGEEPLGPNTAETCNTYNMLRLTKQLMGWNPDAAYGDYYEKALFNQILGTIDPETGMAMYFLSTKPGHFKVYGTPYDSMWCCTGTGIENPGRYLEAAYFHDASTLYINQFIASDLAWKEKGVTLRQETTFPEAPSTKFTFVAAPSSEVPLKIRVPAWAAGPVVVTLNGSEIARGNAGDGWLAISRTFKAGDTVELSLPMKLNLYRASDDPNKVALTYGPIVLAAEMGRDHFPASDLFKDQNTPNNYPAPAAPVLVPSSDDVASWVTPVDGKPLTFQTKVAKPDNVTLIPLYALHHQRYTIYFQSMTPDKYAAREQELRGQQLAVQELDRRTVDQVNPGEQQPDTDHAFKGEKTSAGNHRDRSFRHAENGGWFSYQLKVAPDSANTLRVTYWGGETGARDFDLLIDGKPLAHQKLANDKPNQFFDVDYAIPETLTKGKDKVELKFQALPGNFAGGVFGLRVLRK